MASTEGGGPNCAAAAEADDGEEEEERPVVRLCGGPAVYCLPDMYEVVDRLGRVIGRDRGDGAGRYSPSSR
eukprot:jgi/Tetstr1/444562/TSEL_000290.t1